jgi:hypothetical protein
MREFEKVSKHYSLKKDQSSFPQIVEFNPNEGKLRTPSFDQEQPLGSIKNSRKETVGFNGLQNLNKLQHEIACNLENVNKNLKMIDLVLLKSSFHPKKISSSQAHNNK